MVMATGLFTSYEVDNDKRFQKQLNRALGVLDDLSPVFGEISRDFFKSNKAIFSNKPGQYPDYIDRTTGTTGADTPYAKRKLRLYGKVYPMLVASGKLRDSLTEPSAPNEDTILQIGKRTMIIGTNVENSKGTKYPLFHQSDKKPRRVMPLRKFLFIGPEAGRYVSSEKGRSERYANIMEKWVLKRLEFLASKK